MSSIPDHEVRALVSVARDYLAGNRPQWMKPDVDLIIGSMASVLDAIPKAAQEHRCVESFHHGGSAILVCLCDTVSKGSDFVEAVNAFASHVLAASRGEAPAFSEAQRERAIEEAAMAIHFSFAHDDATSGDCRDKARIAFDVFIAALKETP